MWFFINLFKNMVNSTCSYELCSLIEVAATQQRCHKFDLLSLLRFISDKADTGRCSLPNEENLRCSLLLYYYYTNNIYGIRFLRFLTTQTLVFGTHWCF